MEYNLTFNQLQANVMLPKYSTELQEQLLIKKYFDKDILIEFAEIEKIHMHSAEIGIIKLRLHNDLYLTVYFNQDDLYKHNLSDFKQKEIVTIIGKLISFSYSRIFGMPKEVDYPSFYSFSLVLIQKKTNR